MYSSEKRMTGSTVPTWAIKGGEGEGSYTRVSKVSSKMGSILEGPLQDAVRLQVLSPATTGPIHYADFGCAVGANPLGFADLVVDTLKEKPELGDRDIVCHFADLPSNDFNTLFKQLQEKEKTWFAEGVPGTLFGRMFPRASLHVAISTLTLHYLFQLPESILDKSSPAYNKGRIGCYGASPAAAEAYAEASQQGLRKFFECRAEEMVTGGVLGFYCLARQDPAHPENQLCEGSNYFVLDIEKAWKDLINEGILTEESLDTFNLPFCHPSMEELREAIPPAAFRIEKLEFVYQWPILNEAPGGEGAEAYGKFIASTFHMMRWMLEAHGMAPELTDKLEARYRRNCEDEYAAKKSTGFMISMSLCVGVLVRN